VLLRAGDLVPADVRLISSRDLFVSQSALKFSPYGTGSRRHLDERFSAPEVLKPIRSQLGVTHRVLDVLVPEPSL
jgi:hypothetical protein